MCGTRLLIENSLLCFDKKKIKKLLALTLDEC